MEQKNPQFNLYIRYEDALEEARNFATEHKTSDGKDLYIWEDPRDLYGQKMTISAGIFYPSKYFDSNLAVIFSPGGTVEKEAKAALLYLMDRHKGFNDLELNQIIVGERRSGISGDLNIAIFAYLSKEDDLLRDFICEKAYDLTVGK